MQEVQGMQGWRGEGVEGWRGGRVAGSEGGGGLKRGGGGGGEGMIEIRMMYYIQLLLVLVMWSITTAFDDQFLKARRRESKAVHSLPILPRSIIYQTFFLSLADNPFVFGGLSKEKRRIGFWCEIGMSLTGSGEMVRIVAG